MMIDLEVIKKPVFASLKTVPECAAKAQPRHRRPRQDSLPRPSLARTLPDYRCGASPCANNDLAQSCEGMERYIEHSIGANYPKGGVPADLISYFLSLAPLQSAICALLNKKRYI